MTLSESKSCRYDLDRINHLRSFGRKRNLSTMRIRLFAKLGCFGL